MRKRRLLILLNCAVAMVVVIVLFTRSGQPKYKGRTLEGWAVRLTGSHSHDPSAEEKREAEDAIRYIGTNALPIFLQWIRYEPNTESDLITRDWWRAEFALATGFRLVGQDAAPAIPSLVELMNDRSHAASSERAVEALGWIGAGSIPALLTNLTSPDAPNRVRVAQAFGRYPPLRKNGQAAVPILVQCLQDNDLNVRCAAAYSLGEMKFHPELVVPALTNMMTTDEGKLRSFVFEALGDYGKEARPVVELVQTGLNDSYLGARESATNALRKIAPELLPEVAEDPEQIMIDLPGRY